jgi:hypothetical protein
MCLQVSAARAEVADMRRSKEGVEATLAATREQLAAAQGQVRRRQYVINSAPGAGSALTCTASLCVLWSVFTMCTMLLVHATEPCV